MQKLSAVKRVINIREVDSFDTWVKLIPYFELSIYREIKFAPNCYVFFFFWHTGHI